MAVYFKNGVEFEIIASRGSLLFLPSSRVGRNFLCSALRMHRLEHSLNLLSRKYVKATRDFIIGHDATASVLTKMFRYAIASKDNPQRG